MLQYISKIIFLFIINVFVLFVFVFLSCRCYWWCSSPLEHIAVWVAYSILSLNVQWLHCVTEQENNMSSTNLGLLISWGFVWTSLKVSPLGQNHDDIMCSSVQALHWWELQFQVIHNKKIHSLFWGFMKTFLIWNVSIFMVIKNHDKIVCVVLYKPCRGFFLNFWFLTNVIWKFNK